MKNYTNTGISLMILTTFLFSCMDGVSKYLAENNNIISLVAFRYWFILVFIFSYINRVISIVESEKLNQSFFYPKIEKINNLIIESNYRENGSEE